MINRLRNIIKRYCIKTQGVYTYGLPVLVFFHLVFILSYDRDWYINNYWWLDVYMNCAIFFGWRELRSVYHYRKCQYQEYSCYALITLGCFNLIKSYRVKDLDINSEQYASYIDSYHIVTIFVLIPFLIKIGKEIYNEIKTSYGE